VSGSGGAGGVLPGAPAFTDLVGCSRLTDPGVDPVVVRIPTAAGTTVDLTVAAARIVRPPRAELDRLLPPRVQQGFHTTALVLVECRVTGRNRAAVHVLVPVAGGGVRAVTVPPAAVARDR
jgi:hypothetical protein